MTEKEQLTREELKDRVTLFFDRNDVPIEDRERVCRWIADEYLQEILYSDEVPDLDEEDDEDFDIVDEDDEEADLEPMKELPKQLYATKNIKKKPSKTKKYKVKEELKEIDPNVQNEEDHPETNQ